MPETAALYDRDDRSLAKRIKKVFKACGIETNCKVDGCSKQSVDEGFHSLRHSFVSLSANAGANLAAVQAVVGHSSPAMTRHYLHADPNNVKNAVSSCPMRMDISAPSSRPLERCPDARPVGFAPSPFPLGRQAGST